VDPVPCRPVLFPVIAQGFEEPDHRYSALVLNLIAHDKQLYAKVRLLNQTHGILSQKVKKQKRNILSDSCLHIRRIFFPTHVIKNYIYRQNPNRCGQANDSLPFFFASSLLPEHLAGTKAKANG
jgi:hypothetical protein